MVRRDEEYFARFTRESLDRIGKLVRSLKWAWGSLHGDEFWEKRDEFISTIVPSFYSCQCVPVLERDWILWFIENSKGDKMCNRCFWIKEVGLFFHIFIWYNSVLVPVIIGLLKPGNGVDQVELLRLAELCVEKADQFEQVELLVLVELSEILEQADHVVEKMQRSVVEKLVESEVNMIVSGEL
ncbi:hypothetical protein F2Q70_00001847 [Brassica cretica]|uniref:Uncharacterized protein n=1 Tax=Brassica cretica TaxID=69181 RepID=A0A8S9J3J8_BRACR|nr:hypothetical protein F2Q70_00001847 [Brassica cretica]